ncbi:PhzF family phenazine biosynthesis protein [Sphingomonas sp. SUN039]|uniref:PhzF family phenazine biosynthesis protein n=1 Tax=Sphingomonas sp. SUN039 TaxID=2937787 RepID=UPI002164C597|nr:PhzF family phenazine biosynthesis protein [Sphingomonas sp. SUN039]UVO55614.1 PhzF family phenazine biosynthesis protein [Sphingomonas sp. SUN039]
MKIPFAQIDAFAERPFTGNPAGVMPLDAWLDDAVLQAIAQENNLPETAFIAPDVSGAADYELRWHTPAAEVALCGHATLASGHYVLGADPARSQVTFRTRKSGILTVARSGSGYELTLPAWVASPKPLPEIAAAIGIATPLATLWHESGYALIVLDDEAAVRALKPDLYALHKLGPIVAIATARGEVTDFVSRVFTPFFDIPEDPVTGSAHAVAVPYWAEQFGRDTLTAYQASARGGHVGCRLAGDRVVLSGNCVTVIEGVFSL